MLRRLTSCKCKVILHSTREGAKRTGTKPQNDLKASSASFNIIDPAKPIYKITVQLLFFLLHLPWSIPLLILGWKPANTKSFDIT